MSLGAHEYAATVLYFQRCLKMGCNKFEQPIFFKDLIGTVKVCFKSFIVYFFYGKFKCVNYLYLPRIEYHFMYI